MTIRAMLFDLDNTLYPAASGVMEHIDRRIGEYVQQQLGLSDAESLMLRREFYRTYGTTLRGLQQRYNYNDTEEYLKFVHDVAIEELLQLDSELDEALGRLRVRKVIFTNSPREHAERVLKAMGLEQHFERIFDLRYFNFVGKPDPACYEHILDILGVSGPEALLLEDTSHNLPPAKALGMKTVLIGDARQACPDADYQVQHILEALDIARTLVEPRVAVLRPNPATKQHIRRSA